MNWKHLMSGICAVASFPGALHAAACATLTPSPASMVVSGWDPIGGAAQDLSLNLSLQRVSSSAKSVRLILVDAETAALPLRIAGSNGPRYEITDTATGSLIAYPMSTSVDSTNAPVRAFPNGANASINIAARLHVFANTSPIEDFIGGNSYTQRFWYTAQCRDAQGRVTAQDTLVASGITISATTPKVAKVITAQPALIDFGNFTTATQQLMISIRSTSSLNVTAATQNGGKFLRDGTPAPVPDYAAIPYTMIFGQKTVASGGSLVNFPRAGVPGKDIPFTLTLPGGVPTGKMAGTYSDVITLTISPGQ